MLSHAVLYLKFVLDTSFVLHSPSYRPTFITTEVSIDKSIYNFFRSVYLNNVMSVYCRYENTASSPSVSGGYIYKNDVGYCIDKLSLTKHRLFYCIAYSAAKY